MKKILFFIIWGMLFVNKSYIFSADCKTNVDSLFHVNFVELKEIIKDSSNNVVVQETSNVEFLYVVTLLSGKNFIADPHAVVVNSKIILEIEKWYKDNKECVTCEKIMKAYSLLLPPLFKSIEELDEYSKEMDQLEIKNK